MRDLAHLRMFKKLARRTAGDGEVEMPMRGSGFAIEAHAQIPEQQRVVLLIFCAELVACTH